MSFAPELFLASAVSEKSDQYSFGVVLWEMITCERPWDGMSAMQACSLRAPLALPWL